MDLLKKYWPTPFKIEKGNFVSFIIQLLIFIVVCAVVTWLFSLLGKIWVVGFIFRILAGLMDIYGLIGIVLCVLVFVGVIK